MPSAKAIKPAPAKPASAKRAPLFPPVPARPAPRPDAHSEARASRTNEIIAVARLREDELKRQGYFF